MAIYRSEKKHADNENRRQFPNDKSGFKDLFSWFKKNKVRSCEIAICMEHTGVYTYELHHSFGLICGKNDKVDAWRIAHYCWLHRDELHYSRLADSVMLKLKELLAERKRYVNQLSQIKAFRKDREGHLKESISERSSRMQEYLKQVIDEIEKEMLELIKTDESLFKNYQLITGIKGIAFVNAMSAIIQTENFTSFETARQYAGYLGIALFTFTYGTGVKRRTRTVPIGAKSLKANLTQAAITAITYDKELNSYFERKRKKGKAYGVVLNAVKFKLVQRIFAVVKTGTFM